MAYNLETLVKIVEQIIHPGLHHPWTLDPDRKPEIELLLKKTRALKQLFGISSPLTGGKIECLGSRIRDAAIKAEDILESKLVGAVRSSCSRGCSSFIFSPPSLQEVIGELSSVEEEMKTMMAANPKKILVGLRQDSLQLKDRLTGSEPKLEIIPIVGMGGIGKTTLSRYVYDDPLVASHFDIRAWFTISQGYSVRAALIGLLESIIGEIKDALMRQEENDEELGVHLHKVLWGRRYLIVLDDVWEKQAWDEIQRFFPDCNNRSRVMITTREMSVANHARSNSSHHQMQFLNKDESWNLLSQKVFAQESCPPGFEAIGRRIANSCGGLPLAIHAICGVLSQAKARESWEQIAKDVATVAAENDEQFENILSLSYNHLPHHLKPCFLYTSAFPEDCEIGHSKLIRLLVAEGFLEPISNKSLEEAAEVYLKALIDRNLIFVRRQETNGFVKSYGMHDLLRELCVRKARQEKFLYIKTRQVREDFPTLSMRRLCVDSDDPIEDNCDLTTRTVLCFLHSWRWMESCRNVSIFRLVLLRVLDILSLRNYSIPETSLYTAPFPEELMLLVNLRYLAFQSGTNLPPSISNLCNLQTIILRDAEASYKRDGRQRLFEMPQLRHIKFLETYPLYKPRHALVNENLQTLTGIQVCDGFDGIIRLAPNLRKLGIFDSRVSSSIDLTSLRKLEVLKVRKSMPTWPILPFLILPPSLKKLSLENLEIGSGFMNKIGSLPNLEVLKLRKCTLSSSTWGPVEGAFRMLQFLLLDKLNLVMWEADETNFPRLQRLVVRDCDKLEEIPLGIGEICTLESIEVHECSPSVVASARKIREEQLEFGNDGLKLLITVGDVSHSPEASSYVTREFSCDVPYSALD